MVYNEFKIKFKFILEFKATVGGNMANIGHQEKYQKTRSHILRHAMLLFLKHGYTATKITDIAASAGVDKNSVYYIFKDKETVISELVAYVLEAQLDFTKALLKGRTEDKMLIYAVETTLQLYTAESSEHIREMYNVSYSLPKTSDVIYQTVSEKLEDIFGAHLPWLESKDFFELEIATGGIMRGLISVPCDRYFTMERKVKRFIETVFLIYRVPDEKISETLNFVNSFDYPVLVKQFMEYLPDYLSSKL